jgi:dihydroxy-acid dehydratase
MNRLASSGANFLAEGLDGTAHRMFLRAAGHSDETARRSPVIGICSSWSELTPCNMGLRSLAAGVARGIIAAGGQPLEFPTISLSEPFTTPSTMFLRNLMAMDVEEMIVASPIDGVVLLNGCDKTVPAQLLGALSAGRPAISLAAGPRASRQWKGETLTTDDVWGLMDDRRSGKLDDDEWKTLEGLMIGGIGTCNVMGTSATMAVIAEVLGMALPGTALLPATGSARREAAERTGVRAVELAKQGTTPDAFITPVSLRNALRAVCALGASTNALIHLQALSGRLGEPFTLEEIGEIASTTPLLAAVKPSGEHLLEEFDEAGGTPGLMRNLGSLVDLSTLSGTGAAWEETLTDVAERSSGPLRTLADPVDTDGGMAILQGSLAPRGAVLKRSAADDRLQSHSGPALVFDSIADMRARIDDPALPATADTVLVLRNAGPLGAPGMPENGAIPIPSRLLNEGVTDMLRISDTRMSGTAAGTIVLHVAPEAAAGGPLALVRDGDEIALDTAAGTLELLVDEAELELRRKAWKAPSPPLRGYAKMFHEHVLQADEGCDFDFLRDGGQKPANV